MSYARASVAHRFIAAVCFALMLFMGAGASAASPITKLADRLANGEDFRVRVQAALELGKTKNPAAREPLEKGLDDDNAAVRAACAAGLKVLGDRRAIPALAKHSKDPSAAVRSQIKNTIASLKGSSASEEKPRVLVKLGRVKDAKGVRSGQLKDEVEKASRKGFDGIPGVLVMDDSDSQAGAKLPVVMVTGQVRKLKASAEGSSVVYSASVEFMVHRMPEHAIAGTVSGSASTTATRAEARDRRRSVELQRAVLAAAVDSAVRRAPEALYAAAK